jgi:steroid delta-isomerase-like uncharacterized protein
MQTVDRRQRARALVAGMLRVWETRDTGALRTLLTEDVVWHDPALPAPAHGLDGVRRFMTDSWQAYPDLAFTPTTAVCLSEDGNTVVVGWQMTGTHLGVIRPSGYAPTGRSFTVQGVDLFMLRGERAATYRASYDTATVSRQLGLLPRPGSGVERALVRAQGLATRSSRRRRRP